jgi:predicted metalloprotease with PDZ domain
MFALVLYYSKKINMKTKCILIAVCFLLFVNLTNAQNTQQYKIDLTKVEENRLKVELVVASATYQNFSDEVVFQFPKTIPGTYAVLDYGRFINNFVALDANKKVLKIKKQGENNFVIYGKPSFISYVVKDSYHTKQKKNKIFEPAGTNIQKDENIIFNNSGFFGIFKGTENTAIELLIEKPSNFYAVTSLSSTLQNNTQIFKANDYHELVDNPIMFSEPDTTSFMVANCKVTIGVYNESGRQISKDIYKEIEKSMQALGLFFENELPVDNYSFIIYLKDYTEYKGIFEGDKIGFFKIIKIIRSFSGQGFGALEHGNSSMYFLPDFGNDLAVKTIKDIASHEFLHIVTPLNLHSEHIGNFNYEDPKMSKHLWLYEGITEYFAGLALTQGKVTDPWKYLSDVLAGKISSGSKFPFAKMSFTEMSENVFNEPHKSQYQQVYERGALMGALLDIEIISATNGEKTLKDVVFTLSKKYGKHKNFSEQEFFDEFVAASHPSVKTFIDKYISGRDALAIKEILAKVGIEYNAEYKGMVPVSPFEGVKFTRINLGGKRIVKKVSKEAFIEFKKGDKLNSAEILKLNSSEYGFIADGTKYMIEIERDGKPIKLEVTNKMKEGTKKHYLFRMKNLSAEQERNYKKWLGV